MFGTELLLKEHFLILDNTKKQLIDVKGKREKTAEKVTQRN